MKQVSNAKIIEQKAAVVSEIKDKFENAKSVVFFDYRGISVAEVTELTNLPPCASISALRLSLVKF